MFRSWKIGSAFGIPLYIHSTFLLLPLLVAFNTRDAGWPVALFLLVVTLAVFGCVLLHELGHALMARYFGIRTRDITLYPIGGIARLERMTQRPSEELLVALAGPAVNVVIVGLLVPLVILAILSGVLNGDPLGITTNMGLWPILAHFLLWLTISNLALVIFNMVPAFPMDGGRVLRALLAMPLGQLRATEIAAKVGIGMAILMGALALGAASPWFSANPMLLLVAGFVVLAGQQELYMLRHQEALRQQAGYGSVLEPVLQPVVEPASPVLIQPSRLPEPDLNNPFPAVAFLGGRQVPRQAGFTGFLWDHDYQIWVHWQDGRPVAAYWAQAQ